MPIDTEWTFLLLPRKTIMTGIAILLIGSLFCGSMGILERAIAVLYQVVVSGQLETNVQMLSDNIPVFCLADLVNVFALLINF